MRAAGLSYLKAEDITLKGNSIKPDFDPDITEYDFFVQSDIYGVKIYAEAEKGAVFVDGEKCVNDQGVLIKLSEDYKDYGVDYSKTVEVKAVFDNGQRVYKINIIRENAKRIYDLFVEKLFEDTENGVKMPYQIYLPKNYDGIKKYPLVFVLHGAGQRLQSPDMVLKRYESATVWAKDSEKGINECIVVSPQCAEANGMGWTYFTFILDGVGPANPYELTKWGRSAYKLLQKIKNEYSVDLSRIYLTGVSMGGFGTFELAIEHPDEFAAIAPICGGADPERAEALKSTPVWLFHAADDPVVDYKKWAVPTINALDKAQVKYNKTIYKAGDVFYPNGHFSWTAAYADEKMRNWLFSNTK